MALYSKIGAFWVWSASVYQDVVAYALASLP